MAEERRVNMGKIENEHLVKDKHDEQVNPKHYADLGYYAASHVIPEWGLGFELGNALKYIQRAGKKEGQSPIVDLKKAIWYIERHIHLLDPENEPDPSGLGRAPFAK